MKTCTKCKTEKPEIEFYKNKNTKDGLDFWCKKCASEDKKDRYHNKGGKEKVKLAKKDWYDNKGGKEKQSLTGKEYYKNNKVHINIKGKVYYEKHKEEVSSERKDRYHNKGGKEQAILRKKDWYDNKGGKEKCASTERDRYYNKGGKERKAATSKDWRDNKSGKEKLVLARRIWRKNNPDKCKIISKRSRDRRRELGFRPLNSWFEGSVAHHVNKNDVVYIPETIHKSVPHSLKTGMGMDKINKLAFVSCVMLIGQTVRAEF